MNYVGRNPNRLALKGYGFQVESEGEPAMIIARNIAIAILIIVTVVAIGILLNSISKLC